MKNLNVKKQTKQILDDYGLNFVIEKVPFFAKCRVLNVKSGRKNIKNLPTDYFGLLNTSSMEILNTVKKSYHISQNEEVVRLALEGVRDFPELKVVNAGSLHGGRKVFIQLQIEGDSIIGKDRVKRYVTILDSNDGSCSLSVGIGDYTMSCSNQFYYFYKNGEARFRHSSSLETKILEIPSLIRLALAESIKMTELYKDFVSTKITKDLAHKLVKSLIGVDETMDKKELEELSTKKSNIMESLYENIRHEMNDKGNNLWGLHSGVTRWTTHHKQVPVRDNGRIEGSMTGTNYRVNQASLNFAIDRINTQELVTS